MWQDSNDSRIFFPLAVLTANNCTTGAFLKTSLQPRNLSVSYTYTRINTFSSWNWEMAPSLVLLFTYTHIYMCMYIHIHMCMCIHTHTPHRLPFPDGSPGKESTCNAGNKGDMELIPGLGRSPGGGKCQPTPVFLPGKIPWTEEPCGLQSKGSQRAVHDWASKHTHTYTIFISPQYNSDSEFENHQNNLNYSNWPKLNYHIIKAYSILNFMPSPSSLPIESGSVKSLSCVRLWDPMDCIPPGSSVHGILQARLLEWVAFLSSGALPNPGIKPGSSALKADSLPSVLPGKSQE